MACTSDEDCSFLYSCNLQNQCQHDPVFPFHIYTIFVYLIIPLANGLVNSTGNSMGIFKVLIVMNLLRYQSAQATIITQATVVGSALPNYLSILLRKHPTLQTSLVNFNVVYILVPCCLLGSTLGAFIGQFIPIIAQDILIILVFSYFSKNFYQKYKLKKQKLQQQQKDSLLSKQDQQNSQKPKVFCNIARQSHQKNDNEIQVKLFQQQTKIQNNQIADKNLQRREEVKKNQKSFHVKEIFFNFIVFITFQFIVFMVQGKLPFLKFSNCDIKYIIGIILLIPITLTYLYLIRIYLIKKFDQYQLLNITQQIHLNRRKQFNLIMVGGFAAGIVQGVLGLGSGSCIMTFLLMTSINIQAASATSGFQVLFIGLAALVEGFINGQVDLIDVFFFMGLCVVFGGLVTFLINNYLKNKNKQKISKILLFIIFCLCLLSIIMVIPSAIETYLSSGFGRLLQIRFKC